MTTIKQGDSDSEVICNMFCTKFKLSANLTAIESHIGFGINLSHCHKQRVEYVVIKRK